VKARPDGDPCVVGDCGLPRSAPEHDDESELYSHRYRDDGAEDGQSLVEFALVLPVFLVVVLLLFDAGGILWRFNMTTSIARLVARDASINGPVVASRNGVALAARLGYKGVVTAKYEPGKRDVIVTATTTNRAILFGRNLPITATTSAHVEIVR